jgi:hypothetical protein
MVPLRTVKSVILAKGWEQMDWVTGQLQPSENKVPKNCFVVLLTDQTQQKSISFLKVTFKEMPNGVELICICVSGS